MSIFPQAIAWTMAAALGGASLSMRAHAAPLSSPDPADARAVTPPVVYQSPMAQVRRLSDAPLEAWRQPPAKAETAQGGHGQHQGHQHAHHHRAASPAASAASDPHAGHTGH